MARRFVLVLVLLPALAAVGLGGRQPAPPPARKIIAIAQIKQETNVFSPVKTTLRDFQANGLYYGREILDRGPEAELAGFMKAVKDIGRGGIEVVPIIRAAATSGGPIEAAVYQRFKKELLAGLTKAGHLDGIYLAMHGSMGVEGLHDPEGDLLKAIRTQFGEELPIGVSYDLHANITKAKAEYADFIVGYKTNPHRDQKAAGYASGRILIRTVRGEIKPVMVYDKLKLLKGGGMNIDLLAPMRKIFGQMKQMEKRPGVLSVSNFMVHLWLDEPELGWSTVAVTDGDPVLAQRTADELADLDWAVRDYKHPVPDSPSAAVGIARRSWLARKLGTVVFCDSSDAVNAGGPGENTWILKALLEEGADLVSYVPLRDEVAARQAFAAPLHSTVTLTVGGRLERTYNRPLIFKGEVLKKVEDRYGKTVILKHDGVHLILSELPAGVTHPAFFNDLGLSIWKADIVVVKNLFPFRIWFWLYNRKTVNIGTPGTTNVDVYDLKYEQITRPIYPFDALKNWR